MGLNSRLIRTFAVDFLGVAFNITRPVRVLTDEPSTLYPSSPCKLHALRTRGPHFINELTLKNLFELHGVVIGEYIDNTNIRR